jgi:hypothetical protein
VVVRMASGNKAHMVMTSKGKVVKVEEAAAASSCCVESLNAKLKRERQEQFRKYKGMDKMICRLN